MAGMMVGEASAGAGVLSGSIRCVTAGMGTAGAVLEASDARGAGPSKSNSSKPVRWSADIESKPVSGAAAPGIAAGDRLDPLGEEVIPAVSSVLEGGNGSVGIGDAKVLLVAETAVELVAFQLVEAI